MDVRYFLKRYASWFVIAAILPIVVFAATNREAYTLNSQAAQSPQVRIWIEPSRVVALVGKPVKFKVYADFESSKKLVNGITVSLSGGAGLRIAPATLSYLSPFQGRVSVGEFSLTSQSAGTSDITIVAEAKDAAGQPVDVITSPTTIVTK